MIRRVLDIRPLLARDRAEWAVLGVTVVVVVTLAAALAGLTWRMLGGNDGRDRIAIAEAAAVGTTGTTDITPILTLAPFGGSALTAQPGGAGMILQAIFSAFPAEASSAVIVVGDAPPAAVMPGQTLSSGAVVQSIEIDHVILRVGAGVERLDFPRAPVAEGTTPGTTTVAQTTAPAPTATAPAATPAAPAAVSSTGTTPSVVEQYRQRLAGNAQGVATQMGVTATTGGYRVGETLTPELRAAGLRPGDVVEKVNNQPVGNIDSDRRLMDEAITSGGARVEVLRNGRRMTLSFPLR